MFISKSQLLHSVAPQIIPPHDITPPTEANKENVYPPFGHQSATTEQGKRGKYKGYTFKEKLAMQFKASRRWLEKFKATHSLSR